MKVTFAAGGASAPRLVVRVVEQDKLPATLDATTAEAAKASRFSGKLGQTFESFSGEGALRRNVLAGLGEPAGDARLQAFERAGAAVTAKYLTSGETAVAFDLGESGATAGDAAALLLGAVLRGWRHDVYRTRLPDDQKPTLAEVVVLNAPDGTEAAWVIESAAASDWRCVRPPGLP